MIATHGAFLTEKALKIIRISVKLLLIKSILLLRILNLSINNKIRKLTPLECERLQGLPDNYTAKFSNTTRYKMIGNGFTVQVIKYILSFVSKKTIKKKQLELFH